RGLRGPGAHRPRAIPRYRELGRAYGVDLLGLPAERPPGRPCGAPDPTVARSVLNRPDDSYLGRTLPRLESQRNRMPKVGKKSGQAVNLRSKLDRIHETWKPQIIAELNDAYVKLV